jgi:hypothetical protein
MMGLGVEVEIVCVGLRYTFYPREPSSQSDSEPKSVAFLLFVGTIFNRTSRVLARHNIKSVGLTHMKLSSLLRPVKDHAGIRTPGVYRISCEYGSL